MNYIEQMKAYIAKEEEVLSGLDLDSVNNLMNVLEKARKDGRTVFICGNGGSAATASHFVCDFCKGVSLNKEKKYNFECLSDNTPLMTAIANDIGYDDIFVIPLKAKMHPGDVVVGISGSGNSENVVRALRYAADHGGVTAALVGYDGGKLLSLADCTVHVNVDNMQIVEDVHMILDHMMMYILANSEK